MLPFLPFDTLPFDVIAKPNPKKPTIWQIGNKAYHIRYKKNQRARRIIMRYQQGRIEITEPYAISAQSVISFLKKSEHWLQQQIVTEQKFLTNQPIAHTKTITILGKPVILSFTPLSTASSNRNSGQVRLSGNHLIIPAQTNHQQKLKKFLIALAQRQYPIVIKKYCQMLNQPVPTLSVRDPKTRWGSCRQTREKSFTPNCNKNPNPSRIMLSFRLTLAPVFVLEYLVAHEVAHLQHQHHRAEFWQLVQRLFPETAKAEHWLKTHGRELMRLF